MYPIIESLMKIFSSNFPKGEELDTPLIYTLLVYIISATKQ